MACARGRTVDRRKGNGDLWRLALNVLTHPAPLANLMALALPERLVAEALGRARRTPRSPPPSRTCAASE